MVKLWYMWSAEPFSYLFLFYTKRNYKLHHFPVKAVMKLTGRVAVVCRFLAEKKQKEDFSP